MVVFVHFNLQCPIMVHGAAGRYLRAPGPFEQPNDVRIDRCQPERCIAADARPQNLDSGCKGVIGGCEYGCLERGDP